MEPKTSKKVFAGVVATSNRLETSKPIASTLRTTANGEGLPFLKDVASCANGIMSTIQAIEDGDIDDNFVALALDASGLVYIVIHQCQKELPRDSDLLDRMKISVIELERNLHDIQSFVEKKAHRSLAKRILKHSADEQKIGELRSQLQAWLPNFGRSGEHSVHDVLEGIIDRKLRKIERNHSKNKDLPTAPRQASSSSRIQPSISRSTTEAPGASSLSSSDLISSPRPRPASPAIVSGKRPMHTPPSISISPQPLDEQLSTRIPTPGLPESMPQTADITRRAREEKQAREKALIEAEARKKKLFQEERIRKLAERERWRRSQQEFIRLPDLNLDDMDLDNLPIASSSGAISKFPVSVIPATPTSEVADLSRYGPGPPTPAVRELPRKPPSITSTSEDERVAAALHAKMQRELELEDEREAKKYAAKLQLEMEAEERLRVHHPKLRSSKRKKTRLIESATPSGSDTDVSNVSAPRRSSPSPSRSHPSQSKSNQGGGSPRSRPLHPLPPGLVASQSTSGDRASQTTITNHMNMPKQYHENESDSDN
ncbi:hypothetical protein D9613_004579 [Agrocybe pediades]|uniref:Uncharacterized protein n=1 Tax=Agrocybe pediades TaxID=84607 RepID=A0A8H4QIC3_9AGAR|nr:hypothetical protein D9613_004579 [Agrocybe pediades]